MADWFKTRFVADDRKVRQECAVCSQAYFLPPSKAPKYKTCGGACTKALRRGPVERRQRNCGHCASPFTPRASQVKDGGGRYCSVACATQAMGTDHLNAPEVQQRARANYVEALRTGSYVPARGADNPHWMGGPKAAVRRAIVSGKANERVKAYRKANPERVKEWVAKRKGKWLVRLPRGTIRAIGESQGWCCNGCGTDISEHYHRDHIVALACGGKHEVSNIQLLCASCNVRKWTHSMERFLEQQAQRR